MIFDIVCDPIGRKRRPWCVFTSASDSNNILSWFPKNGIRNWDLVVAFYGDSDASFNEITQRAEVTIRIKGSKFQNLKEIHSVQPGLLKEYRHIWVVDDDISFCSGSVNDLFEIASSFGFIVCQPAFSADGRISHPITKWAGDQSLARIVNFVEVTCPLFRSDCLMQFLDIYDGSLVGWGIDWWFSQYLGGHQSHRFAVIDEVVVLNPLDHQRRTPGREITKLLGDEARKLQWYNTRDRLKLQDYPHKVLAEISRPRVMG